MFFDYKKNRSWTENLTIVMQLGLTVVGSIFFCFLLGRYLDRWFGTRPIFIVIFTILGIIGGGATAYRQILETLRSGNSGRPKSGTENGPKDGSD